MSPAHESLEATHLAGAQDDLGLELGAQFVVRQCLPQAGEHLQAAAAVALVSQLPLSDTRWCPLGGAHGHFGTAKQGRRIRAVLRGTGHAHCDAKISAQIVKTKWPVNARLDGQRSETRHFAPRVSWDCQSELVATDSC